MNPYLIGALAALTFAALIGPLLLLAAPFIAQICDDYRRRNHGWAHNVARYNQRSVERRTLPESPQDGDATVNVGYRMGGGR